jgi:hypothetical protein
VCPERSVQGSVFSSVSVHVGNQFDEPGPCSHVRVDGFTPHRLKLSTREKLVNGSEAEGEGGLERRGRTWRRASSRSASAPAQLRTSNVGRFR